MIIFITGTSSGLGLEVAKKFLISKNNFVIGCSRRKSQIKNKRYKHYQIDLEKLPKISSMIDDIEKKFKKIDILINNAGYLKQFSPLLLMDEKEIYKLVKINLVSTQILTKKIIKIMIKNNFGRIINIGSISSKLLNAGDTIYSSSKLGLVGFTKSLSKEIYSYGITCNCICPTLFDTKNKNLINKNIQKDILYSGAIKKLNKYSEIFDLIKYLTKKNSYFITGQSIYLGGH